MPDFLGSEKIIVQPGTSKMAYEFEVTVCSAAGANDGFLAFGRTIASVVVTAHKHGTTLVDATSELIEGTPTVVNEVMTVKLNYPTTLGSGRYKLEFIMTLDDTSVEEADFGRVLVKDR
jgi:hypothetical protein